MGRTDVDRLSEEVPFSCSSEQPNAAATAETTRSKFSKGNCGTPSYVGKPYAPTTIRATKCQSLGGGEGVRINLLFMYKQREDSSKGCCRMNLREKGRWRLASNFLSSWEHGWLLRYIHLLPGNIMCCCLSSMTGVDSWWHILWELRIYWKNSYNLEHKVDLDGVAGR